jgi:hypothetical protein
MQIVVSAVSQSADALKAPKNWGFLAGGGRQRADNANRMLTAIWSAKVPRLTG